MNLRKITAKKPLKLLVILLSWMIVATASAAIYYSLSMEPKVTTYGAAPVIFVQGDDSATAGASISTDGSWASITNLKAYPNVTMTYDQALNVSNTDTSAHNIRLRHLSISPASGWDVANFTSITFKLVNVAGTEVATFAYTVTGTGASASWNLPSPTGYQSLPGSNTEWAIKIEIIAEANASAGIEVDINIALDTEEA